MVSQLAEANKQVPRHHTCIHSVQKQTHNATLRNTHRSSTQLTCQSDSYTQFVKLCLNTKMVQSSQMTCKYVKSMHYEWSQQSNQSSNPEPTVCDPLPRFPVSLGFHRSFYGAIKNS